MSRPELEMARVIKHLEGSEYAEQFNQILTYSAKLEEHIAEISLDSGYKSLRVGLLEVLLKNSMWWHTHLRLVSQKITDIVLLRGSQRPPDTTAITGIVRTTDVAWTGITMHDVEFSDELIQSFKDCIRSLSISIYGRKPDLKVPQNALMYAKDRMTIAWVHWSENGDGLSLSARVAGYAPQQ